MTRCRLFDNAGGLGPCGTWSDIVHENPWFCAMPLFDFTLNEASACLPANTPRSEQTGALGVGCGGSVPVESASWATIKAMYR